MADDITANVTPGFSWTPDASGKVQVTPDRLRLAATPVVVIPGSTISINTGTANEFVINGDGIFFRAVRDPVSQTAAIYVGESESSNTLWTTIDIS